MPGARPRCAGRFAVEDRPTSRSPALVAMFQLKLEPETSMLPHEPAHQGGAIQFSAEQKEVEFPPWFELARIEKDRPVPGDIDQIDRPRFIAQRQDSPLPRTFVPLYKK